MVARGLSDENGSWKIIWMRLRWGRMELRDRPTNSCPSSRMLPWSGWMRPATILPSVDLPHPDSPASARVSPRAMEKLTPSVAVKRPARVA
jgi:hypothetical protein